jgi:membrane fusion protein (multidrug efflux system)
MKTIKYSFVYVLLFAILAMSCNTQDYKGGAQAASSKDKLIEHVNTPTVEVVNPQYRQFTNTSSLVGTLRPYYEVKLYTMESGYVRSITKDIGDPVKANEVIVRLENPEIQRKYQEVQAQFNVKKSIHERLASIYEQTPDLTTIEQLEVAKAEFESSKARLAAIKDQLGFLTVRAPFSGIITERYVDHGDLVQSGLSQTSAQPLVDVMDISRLRLNIHLPESEVSSVQVGDSLSAIFPEFTGKEFQATISRIANALNRNTKTMRVEVDIVNKDLQLKPGMYARVELTLKSSPNTLSVPHPAISVEKNQYCIYKVLDGKIERQIVQLGLQNKNFVEILNSQLTPDDQVVVTGKQLISPGMNVKAINKNYTKEREGPVAKDMSVESINKNKQ